MNSRFGRVASVALLAGVLALGPGWSAWADYSIRQVTSSGAIEDHAGGRGRHYVSKCTTPGACNNLVIQGEKLALYDDSTGAVVTGSDHSWQIGTLTSKYDIFPHDSNGCTQLTPKTGATFPTGTVRNPSIGNDLVQVRALDGTAKSSPTPT